MITLGIVVPCFNEEAVLPETCRRLAAVLRQLQAAGKAAPSSRIFFVDDGSRDRTWPLIEGMVAAGEPVAGIRLSRNRGHQNALLAGLLAAPGDALVSIDADLQDDVGQIEAMVDRHAEGCDVVYGVRKRRDADTWFKRATATGFYRLIALMGVETVRDHADYRLLSRRAIDGLRGYGEVNLYLRGIVPLLGFRTAVVEYARSERLAGESKYPLRKMLSLALEAVTSFSVVPLRLVTALGLLVSVGSAVVIGWALWTALIANRALPGWTSTVLPIYFLGGVQMLSLGVIGEYVGKIYLESKARPRYLVAQAIGFPAAAAARPAGESSAESPDAGRAP
jgi:glycosyltransferase involved in cell wall biosynthesis